MTSLFQQQGIGAGPQITPKTMNAAGQGGQQNPPYLQTKTPVGPWANAGANIARPMQSVITPKPSAPGDTIAPRGPAPGGGQWGPGGPQGYTNRVGIQPATGQAQGPANPATPPQQGGQTLGDVYNFFKSDLQNQTNQALANTKTDAAARGVFYGTPLTGSEADINTQYLRGLGQLQAGMYGNEQQNQLARLGLATGLAGQSMFAQPPTPGAQDWSGLGALFGTPSQGQGQSVITPRTGPAGLAQQPGNQTQSGSGAGYQFKGFGY